VAQPLRREDVGDARRLRDLEGENGKLKKLPAEAMLDTESRKVIALARSLRRSKRGDRPSHPPPSKAAAASGG